MLVRTARATVRHLRGLGITESFRVTEAKPCPGTKALRYAKALRSGHGNSPPRARYLSAPRELSVPGTVSLRTTKILRAAPAPSRRLARRFLTGHRTTCWYRLIAPGSSTGPA